MRTTLVKAALLFCFIIITVSNAAAANFTLTDSVSGKGFAAIQTAMEAFHQRLPNKNVEDFSIEVYEGEKSTLVEFKDKRIPKLKEGEEMTGSYAGFPHLIVTLTRDGSKILDSTFPM